MLGVALAVVTLICLGIIGYTQVQSHRLTVRVIDRGQATAACAFAAMSMLSNHDPAAARALMDHFDRKMKQVERGEYVSPKTPEAAIAEVEGIIAEANPGGVHN
jgi:hypothetical protein